MKTTTACLLIATSFGFVVHAQEKPAATFRLHFRLHESGPKAEETTRSYVLVLQNEAHGKINASRRLPFYSTSATGAQELHTMALGSILECDAKDAQPGVRLDCAFESSYVEPGQPVETPTGFLPVVNSRQVHTTAVVPVGRETQIAQLDDPSTGNRLEILVSVERSVGPVASNPEAR